MEAPFLFLAIGVGLALPIFVMKEVYRLVLLADKGKVIIEGVRGDQETVLKSKVTILHALFLYVSWKNIKSFNHLIARSKETLCNLLGKTLYARGKMLGKQVKIVETFKKNIFSSVSSSKNLSRARVNFRRIVKKVILTEHYKVSADIVNKLSNSKASQKPRGSISVKRISLFSANPERRTSVKSGAQLVGCLLYTSPSPRDRQKSRMPSSA
eukprot:TRINITY_DN22824_c0_g1_i1.p1 TRINITY_DN22824_c0_g1~~TRINITY_DN22824_c0_g1_i1.p1  ORF type:complete len:212 (-),score=24.91 TRINITY_DN22824_c0_g1_i1:10-645(-)